MGEGAVGCEASDGDSGSDNAGCDDADADGGGGDGGGGGGNGADGNGAGCNLAVSLTLTCRFGNSSDARLGEQVAHLGFAAAAIVAGGR